MTTPNLAITHTLQSKAQKEVTANSAFDALDNSDNRALSLDLGDADLILVADRTNRNGLIGVAGGALTVRQGSSSYTNDDFTAGTAVLPVTAVDGFEIRVTSTSSSWDDIQAGIRTWFAIEVVETTDAANPPYDFAWRKEGQSGASEIVLRQVLARLEADFAGSVNIASTAATADADFDVQRNGSSIGTIRFRAGATTPTFIAATAVTLEIGDELTTFAPASADTSLAYLAGMLTGKQILY